MPVFQLSDSPYFPPPELAREDGLLAIGGDLSPDRILIAYQMGIFPWYSEGEPILWWAPSPRLILELDDFRMSKRLARTIKLNKFKITTDKAFREVITSCATITRKIGEGTWITAEMLEAYCLLHELGHAHSVECWLDGKLAGGLYGLAIGGVFSGESMFSKKTDASKVAMAYIVEKLKLWGFDFIDCQIPTDHLKRLGAKEIPADIFYQRLQKSIFKNTATEKWAVGNAD